MSETLHTVERTVSAPVLISYYNRFSDQYDNGYPVVANPPALMDGIANVARRMSEGKLPDRLLLYVIEDEEDEANPREAQYVIALTSERKAGNDSEMPDAFFLRLFYSKTNQMESVSTIEESRVVWSPDTMDNSRHPQRTRYYLGFTYMLCNNSPDFDVVPIPEYELTGAELVGIVEGELPPEVIEIKLPESVESPDSIEETAEPTRRGSEKPTREERALEYVEEDDTELILESPETYEEEYDDLETDYEELFD